MIRLGLLKVIEEMFLPIIYNKPVYLPTTASSSGDDTEKQKQIEDFRTCSARILCPGVTDSKWFTLTVMLIMDV